MKCIKICLQLDNLLSDQYFQRAESKRSEYKEEYPEEEIQAVIDNGDIVNILDDSNH